MESKRSIFPIAKGELDDFIGVVQAKDILALLFSEEKFDINSIIKKPLVVSENLETLELLKEFKEKARREIENLTAMNVISLDVVAKNIYVPGSD